MFVIVFVSSYFLSLFLSFVHFICFLPTKSAFALTAPFYISFQNITMATPTTTIINKAIRAAYIINDAGEMKPIVCLVCDRFVKPDKMALLDLDTIKEHKHLLMVNSHYCIHPDLQKQYTIQKPDTIHAEDINDVLPCMLSRRSSYLHNHENATKSGFTVCLVCKQSLKKQKMPLYSIVNNYSFGETPSVLFNLTQIELSMITPVKTFGYCFSFTGGFQKHLKGSLSYYKISPETITQTGAQLEGLGLNDHVVILLYGSLTKEQKKRVETKYEINTHRIILAIRWLLDHNINWIPFRSKYDKIIKQIKKPILYDDSTTAISTPELCFDKYIEHTDSFQVFYPDGTVSVLTGGQQNIDDFQEVVKNATKGGFRIECRVSVISEAVDDYKGDNLVNACLIQFPYGRGGLNEFRLNKDGETTSINDIEQYTKYISMISLRQFHEELFTLQIYNMQMKYKMVNSAGWKIRHKLCAQLLAKQLTAQDIYDAIENTRNATGNYGRGHVLLGAIDTICKTIPHTNEAARRARREIETMQHHFGCPTFFLTVTPDDDNHILVQIYASSICSANKNINTMSDDEINELVQKKTALRIKYPGLCAYFFEIILDIIIKDVLRWDKTKNVPIGNIPSIFGKIDALSVSVEEQGRRTLHAHLLLWVGELNRTRNKMYSCTEHTMREAAKIIINKVDDLCSSKMFFNGDIVPRRATTLNRTFPHVCSQNDYQQQHYPTSVPDQQLRNLRCRQPHSKTAFVCETCQSQWTSTGMVTSYLKNYIQVPNIGEDYHANTRRLKNLATQFQLEADVDEMVPNWIVDASYNHHVHTASCFKHKPNQNNKVALSEECRYRYPQRPKRKTVIQVTSPIKQPWYLWNGNNRQRLIKEINVKRSEYDIFQNNCCPQISYSNLACNTNLHFILPGPVAHYCIGYTMKNTQKDDTKEYESVRLVSEKILSKVKEDDTCEGVAFRRLLATTFAHQSNNVVGAAMASYLTRNKSRFYFSHQFAWCPLRDITSLLNGEKVNATIAINETSAYFRCEALHYLCRPSELEHISVFQFYSEYEVCKQTQNSKGKFLQFRNNLQFKHPSFNETKNEFSQGVLASKKTRLAKIYQFDFPDTALFDGNILDTLTPINEYTELYSNKVLLLFLPFREKANLLLDNSYTKKLRMVVAENIFDNTVFCFLQNLQDTKANNLRCSLTDDDLQRHTTTPSHRESFTYNPIRESTIDDDSTTSDIHLNQLVQYMEDIAQYIDSDTTENNMYKPSTYSCMGIRTKGRWDCGFTKLPELHGTSLPIVHDFVTSTSTHFVDESIQTDTIHRLPPTPQQLTQILITQQGQEQRSFGDITGQHETVSVRKPNGSAKSIIDWARKSKLDGTQQRAFEVIAGSFVLSYYDPAGSTKNTRHRYSMEKRRLRILVHNNTWSSNQLICFLHGPGGSGKTALIDLVILYAKSFCSYIWSDFESHERVIVVTAMTGVAATLLQGETTHGALYLNQQKQLTPEQVQNWSGVKMVIIDEISFADKNDLVKMDKQIRRLKQQRYLRYGGINIIFSGDFRQLEPVGNSKKPLYEDNVAEFKDWTNSYIELKGIWRFKNDPQWGELLMRLRNGDFSKKDLDLINKKIKLQKKIPPQIRYACYFNRDRDAINSAIFEEKLKYYYSLYNNTSGFILVFSDNILMKSLSNMYKPFNNLKMFWETLSENDLKFANGTGRMDPVLKLYPGCRVMLPTNISVSNGLANGTQATVHRIMLKEGVEPSLTKIGPTVTVSYVFASDVEYIELQHTNPRIHPPLFRVKHKNHTFKVKLPSMPGYNADTFLAEMKATQLPLLHNDATTGHKLQGTGVEEIFVHKWSTVTNWIYVMLSRVKTLNGLYARDSLPDDLSIYSLKPAYKTMIKNFIDKKPIQLTEQQYFKLFNG
jgi:Helitron helicase-like domain at N-terminus/PIF1-like helicase